MTQPRTYRRRLRERALDQYGYVTTRDAKQLGVPAVELRKLAQRGGLEHVGHGLYRFEDVPRTGRDQYMEAVLRVGDGAFLVEDAVLSLHDLAHVNPLQIRVGVAGKAPRRRLPGFVRVVTRPDLAHNARTTYEGIPAETVANALLDCRDSVMPDRLLDAAQKAIAIGLVRRSDAERVLANLRTPA